MPENQPPRSRILSLLRYHVEMSIDELAERLALSKTAMRAHVLKLAALGLIVRVDNKRDGRGRPPARYALSDDGAATFPTSDAAILQRLIAFLQEQGQEEVLEEFFANLWSERRAELLRKLSATSFDEVPLTRRLRQLKRYLHAHHFMPLVRKTKHSDGQLVIIDECNCPLPAAVRATRIPCQQEANFLHEIVGGEPVGAEFANQRTDVCTFSFRRDPE